MEPASSTITPQVIQANQAEEEDEFVVSEAKTDADENVAVRFRRGISPCRSRFLLPCNSRRRDRVATARTRSKAL